LPPVLLRGPWLCERLRILPFKLPSSTLYGCQLLSRLFVLVLRIGRSREYIDLMDEPILIIFISLEYWRNLRSSLDFTDQTLKNCVNVIHIDIVEIWNLFDRHKVSSPQLSAVKNAQRNQYLLSNQFKINMSHVVKDLAIPAGGALPRWVYYMISRDVQ
jgi:hypothetical protein